LLYASTILRGRSVKIIAKYASPYVVCPFYRHENSQSIHCEGISSNTTVHLVFDPRNKKNAYRKKFCERDHMSCPIAKMLYQKYEVGTGET